MEIMAALIVVVVFLVFFCGYLFLLGFAWWKVFRKAGYSGGLGLLMVIPLVNFLMLMMLAFSPWPNQNQAVAADPGPAKENKSFVSGTLAIIAIFLCVVLMIGVIATAAVPAYVRARSRVQDEQARKSLRLISAAIEKYRRDNNDKFPSEEAALIDGVNPYLDQGYNNKTIKGYTYFLALSDGSYAISASPKDCGTSGNKVFRLESGRNFEETACEKSSKE
jgi:type II secretory pathway pseudopilin PulG